MSDTVDTAALRARAAVRDAEGTGVVALDTEDLLALCEAYEQVHDPTATHEPLALGAPSSVQRDSFTGEITLGWWVLAPEGSDRHTDDVAEARIPLEKISDFISDLTNQTASLYYEVGKAYAYGDCDTCGNRRLVDVVRFGRPTNVVCPACREGKPDPVPFGNRPRLRTGTWDPTTPYDEVVKP